MPIRSADPTCQIRVGAFTRLALAAVALACLLTTSTSGWAAPPDRPNFLFILTDDQSPETLSCYGNTRCETPNLDRLAAEGIVFDDAHHMGAWSGAVCTASRTMIMTGRTVWNIPGASGPDFSFPNAERSNVAAASMPAVFNEAGYQTFRTCKRGNSFEHANRLFQTSRVATNRQGVEAAGSQWHGAQVIEFLNAREQAETATPFLIYYGFSHPHDPRYARQELAEKYGANNDGPGDTIPASAPALPLNYLPAHPFPHGHPGLRDEERVQGVMTLRDEATVRNEIGREYACIENIDEQIGRVLDKLESMGELDNTYVIFTSDHGIAVGRHGLMGKQNLYEHTWRVPMIVRGPGITAGSRASGYVYLLDVLPTLCDLAEIEIPESVEGQSFRPVLEGEADRIREVMYGVYCGGTKPGIRAVKSDGWKLIEYETLDGTVRETQLFDLRNNPFEFLTEHLAPELVEQIGHRPSDQQRDLAELAEFADKRRQLEQLLAAEMQRLNDPYQFSTPQRNE